MLQILTHFYSLCFISSNLITVTVTAVYIIVWLVYHIVLIQGLAQ